jgi:type IV pilus assembly protein PilO
MTLDELRNLNINDLSSWPVPIKIVGIVLVGLVILGAGYWFIIKGELEQYAEATAKEEQLKETYTTKKLLAINLDAYKQQMEDMHQTFGSLLRQLPNTTEVPDLLVDITQAGLGRGLEFVLFRPEKEQPRDFYAELPISLQVTGNYHEFASFVSDVAALPRIVTFGQITITSGQANQLTMAATARTYRYLEGGSEQSPKPRKGGK